MTDSWIHTRRPLDIAVIGTGISGMAAAWLLSARHRVTVYEKDDRLGGHTNTVEVPSAAGAVPVDTGFIVYNERNYPNLTALFRHLGVPTQASDMSFAVSLDEGRLEYAGTGLGTLFAQRSNLFRPRFWVMLRDLLRFYRAAPYLLDDPGHEALTLGAYLESHHYSRAFIEDHLLPMAAAIWSAPMATMRSHPAASFVRFCQNHGLLSVLGERPAWRTVTGGSREYVSRLTARYAGRIRLGCAVRALHRGADHVLVEDSRGAAARFDHAVIASHADEALSMLRDPSAEERNLLGAFRYERNLAILHNDAGLMPRRRAVWSSWNYLGRRKDGGDRALCVTYWLNRLQGIPEDESWFMTLNPHRTPRPDSIHRSFLYDHPIFDAEAPHAQRALWRLQGRRNTWFCGAYFGAGFHEDGLQAGLAVAEALGGLRRPWHVADESGRIHLGPVHQPTQAAS
ncbi:MAG TPA: FAD-dependent oxidoreductase [Stellaceae bacterium]|nr:FAD-dependent oxidoreductase [Stellaceae bacterium]